MLDLNKRAMLVKSRIELKGLLGERQDKDAREQMATTYQSVEDQCKASKYLINQKVKSVRNVRTSAQSLRECVYRYTFPWIGSDLNLLPVKVYDSFKKDYDQRLAKHQSAIEDYISDYPSLVAQARLPAPHGLGNLFDADQYPSSDKISRLFHHSLEYMPLPDSGNFVADIAQDAAMEAKASIERKIQEVVVHSFNNIVQRSERLVVLLVDKLSEYRPGQKQGCFRDSLIDNITDLADLIRKLNYTDDIVIDQIAIQLDRLTRNTPEELRNSGLTRADIKSDGEALLAKLESMRKADSEIGNMMESMRDYI